MSQISRRGQMISSDHMKKYWFTSKYLNKFWLLIFTCFICWLLLHFHFYNTNFKHVTNIVNVITISRTVAFRSPLNQTVPVTVQKSIQAEDKDNCADRYIFIQNLPQRFNMDLLNDCKTLSKWTNMCVFLSNNGLGPKLSNTNDNLFVGEGWFETNQFTLEVIFHNRMKHYKCLTKNSSLASAIYVPFYPGLDISKYLWCCDAYTKDFAPKEVVEFLKEKLEWRRMNGKDHFIVAGRICWDFKRPINSDWGSTFLQLPEISNMTTLVLESSPWNDTDVAIPYPTYFHPSNDQEIFQWQNRMRNVVRTYLFSFAGAPRPDQPGSVRGQIITQCRNTQKCYLLECGIGESECHNPNTPMKMFQTSIFCLQPPGDSFTRRSIFDSILAGCIPVFFHPASAYLQYKWHLYKNFKSYSIYIPMNRMRDANISVENELMKISKKRVVSLREEVIKLIPNVIYADPNSGLEKLEDAFDITVKGVLNKVKKMRERMVQGNDNGVKVEG